MNQYKVFVEGRNFLIAGTDGEAKRGFFTTRFVEAADVEDAEGAAVEQLRARQDLHDLTRNRPDDPPRLFVLEIEELHSFDGLMSSDQGLVWYPEDGETVDVETVDVESDDDRAVSN